MICIKCGYILFHLSHDFDDKDTKKNIKTMDSAEKMCIFCTRKSIHIKM